MARAPGVGCSRRHRRWSPAPTSWGRHLGCGHPASSLRHSDAAIGQPRWLSPRRPMKSVCRVSRRSRDVRQESGIQEMSWQKKCKISPRLGSCMAGIFTILVTIQSLLLDLNQAFSFGKDPNKFNIYKELHGVVLWTFSHKNNITIFLSITTLMASCFLLYSVHMKLYLGLLVYILWIIIYEMTCFSLILLISQDVASTSQEGSSPGVSALNQQLLPKQLLWTVYYTKSWERFEGKKD
ncbi:putative transmembrane protein 217B [Macrotis lagotis]|uniref:putative transmembrane protein 217B n=1 Tax=Macrotis lagotis TaxID=92651 RepID=UPI003D68E606